jgi:acyl-CoA synthetase (AMP-forming)/AMP-acid ligase II/alkylation response protein AidB-like acyl-CoA dehydrogenase/acyl carrier protein
MINDINKNEKYGVITDTIYINDNSIKIDDNIRYLPGKYIDNEVNNNICLIQYSSGSTSKPKGIILTHDNIQSNIDAYINKYGECNFKVGCCWAPLQHDMGLIGTVFTTLYCKAKSVIINTDEFKKDPSIWLKLIDKYKATFTFTPNIAFRLCNKIKKDKLTNLDLSSWKLAVNGGEHICINTLVDFYNKYREYGVKDNIINPSYGLSETVMVMTCHSQGEPIEYLVNNKQYYLTNQPDIKPIPSSAIINCGGALNNHTIKILPSYLENNDFDEQIGEIIVRGESIAAGYFDSSGSSIYGVSNENWTLIDGLSFYRTGDLGFINKNGDLYVIGRIKDIIICYGKNIYLNDIDNEIIKCVHESNIINIATFIINEDECKVGLAIELRDLKKIDYSQITSNIKHIISKRYHLIVECIYYIKNGYFPLTDIGKVPRHKLRALICNNINKYMIDHEYLNYDTAYENRYLIPYEYGGYNQTIQSYINHIQKISSEDFDKAALLLNQYGVSLLTLLYSNNDTIKNEVLPRVISGEYKISFSFTETSKNQPSSHVSTNYTEHNNGYIISGEKKWGGAKWATHTIIFAKNNGLLSIFLINLNDSRIKIGQTYKLMGLNNLEQAPFSLDKCNVNKGALLEKNGIHTLRKVIAYSRLGVASLAVGGVRNTINKMHTILKDRNMFTGKILDYPIIKERITNINNIYELCHKYVDYVLSVSSEFNYELEWLTNIAKAQITTYFSSILDEAFVSLGAFAYIEKYCFESLYRSGKALLIIEGSNDALFYKIGYDILENKIYNQYMKNEHIQMIENKVEDICKNYEGYDQGNREIISQVYDHIGRSLSSVIMRILSKYPANTSLFNNGSNNHEITQTNAEISDSHNEILSSIKKWMSDELNIEKTSITLTSNIFDLGIDSLYGSMLISYIENEFNIKLETGILWEYSQLHTLIQYLANKINKE